MTQALGIFFNPFRAHCQLWEDGRYRNSTNNSTTTFGQYSEIFTPWCNANKAYDGNWWVYGVHQAYGPLDYNDITSNGYVSSSKSGDVDLVGWNDLSMTIAKSWSSEAAILIPWYELATCKTVLGKDTGRGFLAMVIDGVVPLLEDGDLLPTVSVDREAGTATVFVPKEKGGHFVVTFGLPKAQDQDTSVVSGLR